MTVLHVMNVPFYDNVSVQIFAILPTLFHFEYLFPYYTSATVLRLCIWYMGMVESTSFPKGL